jgi:hypothetical protein
MPQWTLIALIVAFTFFNTVAQEIPAKYHKVRINVSGKSLDMLTKAGLETDHGIYVKNRTFTSDFSDAELEIVRQLGYEYDMLIPDVGTYYAQPHRPSEINKTAWALRTKCSGQPSSAYNYKTPLQYKAGSMGGYFTYQEMLNILDTMAARYPTLIAKRKKISDFKTHNGNAIEYVRLTGDVEKNDETKPKILYTALHHAREPNSLSQMIFYLWYLLENYGHDPMITQLVNTTNMFFVPCVNPDGYIMNQTSNPGGGGLWRKNSWRDDVGNIKGVDINRNYGHMWGKDEIGSSSNPSSSSFRGPSAFSEPETQAIRALCLEHDFKIAINYHTFGNFLIHPNISGTTSALQANLLKSYGTIMNQENNFLLGNTLETVGYTTNGDSDSWMFGERAEKDIIFAFTPEVGYLFWHPEEDIDYLNKSCLWMNIAAALLCSNYYDADVNQSTNFLNPNQKNITIRASRLGLSDGNAKFTLSCMTPGVHVVPSTMTATLPLGTSEMLHFAIETNDPLNHADKLNFSLEIDNNGIKTVKTFEKQWIPKPLSTIYYNDGTDLGMFESNGWNFSDSIYYQPPLSFSDSPHGNYLPGTQSTITIKKTIDLTNISYPMLTFYAKWDIEDDYDYVQVMGSKDGKDFIPLCGRFTKPGTVHQSYNSPLYDGKMDQWVMEEIDLSLFAGAPKVWVRFLIKTDEFEQRDGFYFDNLEVKGENNAISGVASETEVLRLFPSVISGVEELHISGMLLTSNAICIIKNIMGNEVFRADAGNGTVTIDATLWPEGLYLYSIVENNITIGSGKLTVMR